MPLFPSITYQHSASSSSSTITLTDSTGTDSKNAVAIVQAAYTGTTTGRELGDLVDDSGDTGWELVAASDHPDSGSNVIFATWLNRRYRNGVPTRRLKITDQGSAGQKSMQLAVIEDVEIQYDDWRSQDYGGASGKTHYVLDTAAPVQPIPRQDYGYLVLMPQHWSIGPSGMAHSDWTDVETVYNVSSNKLLLEQWTGIINETPSNRITKTTSNNVRCDCSGAIWLKPAQVPKVVPRIAESPARNKTIPHGEAILPVGGTWTPPAEDDTYYDVDGLEVTFFAEKGKKYLVSSSLMPQMYRASYSNNNAKYVACQFYETVDGVQTWTSQDLPCTDKYLSGGWTHTYNHCPSKLVYGDNKQHTFKARLRSRTDWVGQMKERSHISWLELPKDTIVLEDTPGLSDNSSSVGSADATIRRSWTLPEGDWIAFGSHSASSENDNSSNQAWYYRPRNAANDAAEVLCYNRPYTLSIQAASAWLDLEDKDYQIDLYHDTSSTNEGLKRYDPLLIIIPKQSFLGCSSERSNLTDGASVDTDITIPVAPLDGEQYLFNAHASLEAFTGVWDVTVEDNENNWYVHTRTSGNWSGWFNIGFSRFLNASDFDFSVFTFDQNRINGTADRQGWYANVGYLNLGYKPRGLGDESLWYCPTIRDTGQELSGNDVRATIHADTALTTMFGKEGSRAYQFSRSTNSDINFGKHIEDTDTAFTMACWVKSTDLENFSVIMGQSSTALTAGAAVYYANDGSLTAYVGNYSSQNVTAPAGTLKENEWTHVCFTAEAPDNVTNVTMRLYINGQLIDEDIAGGRDFSTDAWDTYDMKLGRAGGYDMTGYIDDFRFIKNRAANEAEVAFLAQSRGRELPEGLGKELCWHSHNHASHEAGMVDLSGNGQFASTGGIDTSDPIRATDGYELIEAEETRIVFPDNAVFTDDAILTGDWAITFWAKTSDTKSSNVGHILRHCDSTDRSGFAIHYAQTEQFQFRWGPDNLTRTHTCNSGAVNDGEWHHYAFVMRRSLGVTQSYQDGVLYNTTTDVDDIANPLAVDLYVGFQSGQGDEAWDGFVDDIRILPYNLSHTEISQLARSRDQPALGRELFHLQRKLDIGQGVSFRDQGSAGLVGTMASTVVTDGRVELKEGVPAVKTDYLTDVSTEIYELPVVDALRPTKGITLSAWFYGDTDNDYTHLIVCDDGSRDSYSLLVKDGGASRNIRLEIDNSQGSQVSITAVMPSTSELLSTQWNHIAATFDADSGDAKIYMNGHLMHEETVTAGDLIYPATTNINYCHDTSPGQTISGWATDFRIFGEALDPYEIGWLAIRPGIEGSPNQAYNMLAQVGVHDRQTWDDSDLVCHFPLQSMETRQSLRYTEDKTGSVLGIPNNDNFSILTDGPNTWLPNCFKGDGTAKIEFLGEPFKFNSQKGYTCAFWVRHQIVDTVGRTCVSFSGSASNRTQNIDCHVSATTSALKHSQSGTEVLKNTVRPTNDDEWNLVIVTAHAEGWKPAYHFVYAPHVDDVNNDDQFRYHIFELDTTPSTLYSDINEGAIFYDSRTNGRYYDGSMADVFLWNDSHPWSIIAPALLHGPTPYNTFRPQILIYDEEVHLDLGLWHDGYVGETKTYLWEIEREDGLIYQSGETTETQLIVPGAFDTGLWRVNVRCKNENGWDDDEVVSSPFRTLNNHESGLALRYNATLDDIASRNTTARDISGLSRNGTETNMDHSFQTYLGYSKDEINGRYFRYLNDEGSWNYGAQHSAFTLDGGPITVSLWRKHDQNGQYAVGGAMAASVNADTNNRASIAFYNDGYLYWDYGNTSTGRLSYANYDSDWRGNGWHHIVCQSDGIGGTRKRVWINGVLIVTSDAGSDGPGTGLNTEQACGWGLTSAQGSGGSFSWSTKGDITDMRIYRSFKDEADLAILGQYPGAPSLGDEYAWWKIFDDRLAWNNFEVYDYSGNKFHATVPSGQASPNPVSLKSDEVSRSWEFEATAAAEERIQAPINTVEEYLDRGATYSGWFRVDANTDTKCYLMAKAEVGSTQFQTYIEHEATGKFAFRKSTDTTDLNVIGDSFDEIALGEWFHLAVTHNGGLLQTDVTIYINGNSISTTSGNDATGTWRERSNNQWMVGSAGDGSSALDGEVADVRIYDRVLDAAEIKLQAQDRSATLSHKPVGIGDEVVWINPSMWGHLYDETETVFGKAFNMPNFIPNYGPGYLQKYHSYWPDHNYYDPLTDSFRFYEFSSHWADDLGLKIVDQAAANYIDGLQYSFYHAGNTGIRIPLPGLNKMDPQQQDATFSMWIRQTGNIGTNSTNILLGNSGSSNTRRFDLSYGDSGGSDRLQLRTGNTNCFVSLGSSTYARWMHVLGRHSKNGSVDMITKAWDTDGTEHETYDRVDHGTRSSITTQAQVASNTNISTCFGLGNNAWGNHAFYWTDARFFDRWLDDSEVALLQKSPIWTRDYDDPYVPTPVGGFFSPFIPPQYRVSPISLNRVYQ